MKILGIETSCDETAAAVVEKTKSGDLRVLSNVVASSEELHRKTGGVVPEQAAREQIKSIIPVVKEAVGTPYTDHRSLSAIAITAGPGLIGSLLVGVEAARSLSYVWRVPLFLINHVPAHIYANWLTSEAKQPNLPSISLVVSGGHTELFYMQNHQAITWLGGTRDDAAGEAFDKTARLLGLPYPGGPAISAAAEKILSSKSEIPNLNMFPRPLIDSDGLDFSFSGLKTAVGNRIKEQESKRVKVDIAELAAQIQEAIVDSLVAKSLKAVEIYKPKSFILGGGVAANDRLREKLSSDIGRQTSDVKLFMPPKELTGDNAAMIAATAFFRGKKSNWASARADPNFAFD